MPLKMMNYGTFLLLVPLGVSLIVQSHVLFNDFLLDDFLHLYNVSNLSFLEAINQPMGGHLLHSFTSVFWAIKYLFGPNPMAFFVVGLAVHLASVFILFQLISRLTARPHLAAFGATLWGMSPIIPGTLGWISVHGQAYATTAVLWVLLDLVRCNARVASPTIGMLLRHTVLLLVAATSFGSGLAATLVLFLVVLVWNPAPEYYRRLVCAYVGVAVLTVAFYGFSMSMLVEAGSELGDRRDSVLLAINNLHLVFAGYSKLLAVGVSALVMGPVLIGDIAIIPAEPLVMIASTFAACVMAPLLLFGIFSATPTERRRILGLLIIPAAAYGLIALARSISFFPLQADAVRYHYFPTAHLVIVLCLLISVGLSRLPVKTVSKGRSLFFGWLVLAIVPFMLGPATPQKPVVMKRQSANYHDSMRRIEAVIKARSGSEQITIPNRPFNVFVWGYTPDRFPGWAGFFVIHYPSNEVAGTPVRFLEKSASVFDQIKKPEGTRIANLIVSEPPAAHSQSTAK